MEISTHIPSMEQTLVDTWYTYRSWQRQWLRWWWLWSTHDFISLNLIAVIKDFLPSMIDAIFLEFLETFHKNRPSGTPWGWPSQDHHDSCPNNRCCPQDSTHKEFDKRQSPLFLNDLWIPDVKWQQCPELSRVGVVSQSVVGTTNWKVMREEPFNTPDNNIPGDQKTCHLYQSW